jgi:hypothetical protein
MTAPYSQCASYSSFGNFVSFAASSNPYVGLGYTAGDGAAIFRPCSRHLVGDWWMFTMGTGGDGGCPVGYTFRHAG